MYIYIYTNNIHAYICHSNSQKCNHNTNPIYIYVYIYIYGLGHIPPAFCDISKSHELKQFRVKGLGYMSLGFRLPNFPISQIVLGHLGWDYLGNFEIGKYIPLQISQFPNFPKCAEPDGLRSFGKF